MNPDIKGKLLALSCAILWAVAVILFKKSTDKMHPMALNLYKSIVTSLLFLPLFLWSAPISFTFNVALPDLGIIILSGLLGITLADTLFFNSLNRLGAGFLAIVECTYSPFMLIMSLMFLDQVLSAAHVVGCTLVVGAVLIAMSKFDQTSISSGKTLGVLMALGAMLCLSGSIIMISPFLNDYPLLWLTGIRIFAGALGLLIYTGVRSNRGQHWKAVLSISNFRYAFPGTVLGTFLAMIIWIAAFRLTDVNSAAILNQTSTIFIVILAAVFLKESFTLRRVIATALAFAGSLIVTIPGLF